MRARVTNWVADGAIAICEMLFQTSLVTLVGIGDEHTMSPRKLQITNTKVCILDLEAGEGRNMGGVGLFGVLGDVNGGLTVG